MPYALKSSGVGLGLLLLVLISVITDYSVNLIIIGGALSNTMTYQEMVRVAYGKPGYILITVMQAVYPFIAMVSYNVIIGDTLTKIIGRVGGDQVANTVLSDRNFTVFLATVAILIPLSLYKNIAKLTKTSLLSTGIICLILVSITIRAPVYAAQVVPSEYQWTFANSRIPQAIGIMAFAFMCQHNTYLCFHSLQRRSLERWALVVHLAVGFAMLASSLFGLIGFASFATGVQGDILENYCPRDDLINVSRLLFAVTIMLTYPMECFVVREVVENYFFQHPPPLWRHILLTTGIVALAYLVSMTTSCVSIVLEINGVLTAAPLAYILPPLCVMRLQNEPFFRMPNLPMLATAAFGIVVAVSGLIVVAMELAEGVRCSEGSEMPYCWGNSTRLARAYGSQSG
uniref:Putative sodium-coupled neutral amino acid transporter 11 n=2 Tax=Macrostomum lignano TaxID=282301 RepID=A0A1I8GZ16_9PLAT